LGSELMKMNRTNNHKIALERLNEAQQLLLLSIEKGALSSLDRDLILEKLRKAYDSILFGNEIDKPHVIAPATIQPTRIKVEKAHEIPVKPSTPEIEPQVAPKPITHQPKAQPVEKPKFAERVSIFDSSIKGLSKVEERVEDSTDEKPQEPSILKAQQPESLVEKFQGNRKSMTDSLSKQFKDKPVASQLQEKPISDLTKEIGVHDRFLFTKELFNGDSKSFEDTLSRVNQFNDISEAIIYIQENFSWNENDKAASKFIELIRRKLLNG